MNIPQPLEIWVNNKRKTSYQVLFTTICATNAREGSTTVIYTPIEGVFQGKPPIYDRELNEFLEKFTIASPRRSCMLRAA